MPTDRNWRQAQMLVATTVGTLAVVALLALAFFNPLCCADDASFAVVSKNLASGHGYLLTLKYFGPDFSGSLFDPQIGTGPASILPVAAAIYIFGAKAWVPSVAHVMMNVLLAAGAIYFAASSTVLASQIVIAFVLLAAATSAFHMEQWYAQLAEVQAALLIILGTAVWARQPHALLSNAIFGACFGLAFLAKHIAALFFFGPLLYFAVHAAFRTQRAERVQTVLQGIAFCASAALPAMLFELWKLCSLGVSEWMSNWSQFWAFVHYQSGARSAMTSLLGLLKVRADAGFDRFAINGWIFIVLLGLFPICLGLGRSQSQSRLLFVLYFGLVAHAAYWIFASNGWPRYAFSAVVILCFLIALCMTSSANPKKLRLCFGAIFLSILVVGLPRLEHQVDLLAAAKRSDDVSAALKTLEAIQMASPSLPVVTQWWAHVATLEYLSTSRGTFRGFEPSKADQIELVLVNARYLNGDDEAFSALLKRCDKTVSVSGVFRLLACHG